MKERIDKIRYCIEKSVLTVNDDLTIIGLRQIELLEELIELTRGKEYGKWIESERPKRIYIGKRKPGRKPQPKPGFKRSRLARDLTSGTEVGKESGTV